MTLAGFLNASHITIGKRTIRIGKLLENFQVLVHSHDRHSVQVQEIFYQNRNGLPLLPADRPNPAREPLAVKCDDLEDQRDAPGIEAVVRVRGYRKGV